jgi:hypothetical protein
MGEKLVGRPQLMLFGNLFAAELREAVCVNARFPLKTEAYLDL